MIQDVRDFYINEIKQSLDKLIPSCTAFFNRMYPGGVDKIPDDKLDWALCQVRKSFEKPHLLKSNVEPEGVE